MTTDSTIAEHRTVEERIRGLGLELPEAPKPVASYVPAVQSGDLVFTSGQIPFVNGNLIYTGRVGAELTIEQGAECARICALNCIAAVKSVIGDLNRIQRVVRLTGFVRGAEGFRDQPKVLNGASDLVLQIFGEKGRHSRLAIGTNDLPLGAPVEIDMIVEIGSTL